MKRISIMALMVGLSVVGRQLAFDPNFGDFDPNFGDYNAICGGNIADSIATIGNRAQGLYQIANLGNGVAQVARASQAAERAGVRSAVLGIAPSSAEVAQANAHVVKAVTQVVAQVATPASNTTPASNIVSSLPARTVRILENTSNKGFDSSSLNEVLKFASDQSGPITDYVSPEEFCLDAGQAANAVGDTLKQFGYKVMPSRWQSIKNLCFGFGKNVTSKFSNKFSNAYAGTKSFVGVNAAKVGSKISNAYAGTKSFVGVNAAKAGAKFSNAYAGTKNFTKNTVKAVNDSRVTQYAKRIANDFKGAPGRLYSNYRTQSYGQSAFDVAATGLVVGTCAWASLKLAKKAGSLAVRGYNRIKEACSAVEEKNENN